MHERLDTAAPYITQSEYVILNSRGTPHKPPPRDACGFPIDESEASAEYLVNQHGIDSNKILIDSWSKDTIGNAYFALTNFCIPRGLQKLIVITSEFHMPRSRLIFDHIFGFLPSMTLEYIASADVGIPQQALQARKEKESTSAEHYESSITKKITDLRSLNNFIFSEHDAYRYVPAKVRKSDREVILDTY